ncbi:MAG: WD40 repeat domain-containing protein [Planctomycetota bacterium]
MKNLRESKCFDFGATHLLFLGMGLIAFTAGCGSGQTTDRFQQMALQRAEANRQAKEDEAAEEAARAAAVKAENSKYGKKSKPEDATAAAAEKEKPEERTAAESPASDKPNTSEEGSLPRRSSVVSKLAGDAGVNAKIIDSETKDDGVDVVVVHSQSSTVIDDDGNRVKVRPREIRTLEQLEAARLALLDPEDRRRGPGNAVVATYLSPDATRLAVVDGNNAIQVVEIEQPETRGGRQRRPNSVLDTFRIEDRTVTAVTFSEDNKTLFVGDSDGGLKKFNVRDRDSGADRFSRLREERRRREPAPVVNDSAITAIQATPDGRSIILGDEKGRLTWRSQAISSGLPELLPVDEKLLRMAVSPDGDRLAAISNQEAFVWSGLSTTPERQSIRAQQVSLNSEYELTAVSFDTNQRLLLGDAGGNLHYQTRDSSRSVKKGIDLSSLAVSGEPILAIDGRLGGRQAELGGASVMIRTADSHFAVRLSGRDFQARPLPERPETASRLVDTQGSDWLAMLDPEASSVLQASESGKTLTMPVPAGTHDAVVMGDSAVIAMQRDGVNKLVFSTLKRRPFGSIDLDGPVDELLTFGDRGIAVLQDQRVRVFEAPASVAERWINVNASNVVEASEGRFVVVRDSSAVLVDTDGKPTKEPVRLSAPITAIAAEDSLVWMATESGSLHRWTLQSGELTEIDFGVPTSSVPVVAVHATAQGKTWTVDQEGVVRVEGVTVDAFGKVDPAFAVFANDTLTTVRDGICLQFNIEGKIVRKSNAEAERITHLSVRDRDGATAWLEDGQKLHWINGEKSSSVRDLKYWIDEPSNEPINLIWSDDRLVVASGRRILIIPEFEPELMLNYQLTTSIKKVFDGANPKVIFKTSNDQLGVLDLGTFVGTADLGFEPVDSCIVADNQLIVASPEGEWRRWNLESNRLLDQGKLEDGCTHVAAISNSDAFAWTITKDGKLDSRTLTGATKLELTDVPVEEILVAGTPGDPGNAMAYVRTADALVHLVPVAPGVPAIDVVEGIRAPINAIAVSPLANWLAIAFDDNRGSTLLFDLKNAASGEQIAKPTMQLTGILPVTSLEFSPDGRKLLVGHVNGSLLLRDVEEGFVDAEYRRSGHVQHLDWDQSGSLVSVHDGAAYRWDMNSPKRQPGSREPFEPFYQARFAGVQDSEVVDEKTPFDPLDEARVALTSGAKTGKVLELMGVDQSVRERMEKSITNLTRLQRDRAASPAELSKQRRTLTRIQEDMRPLGDSQNLSTFADGYSNLAFVGTTDFKFDLHTGGEPVQLKLNDRYLYAGMPTRRPLNLREKLLDRDNKFIGFVDHGDNGTLLGYDYRFSRLQTNAWPIDGMEVDHLITLADNRGVKVAPDARLFLHEGFSHTFGRVVSHATSNLPYPRTQWLALGTEGAVGKETTALSIYDVSKLGTRSAAPQSQYRAFEGSVTAIAFANRRDQIAFAVRERAGHRIFVADVKTLSLRKIASAAHRSPLLQASLDGDPSMSVRSPQAVLGVSTLLFSPDDKKLVAQVQEGAEYRIDQWDLRWGDEQLDSFKPSVSKLDPSTSPFFDTRFASSVKFVSKPLREELQDPADPLSSSYRTAGTKPRIVARSRRDVRVFDLFSMNAERIIPLPFTQSQRVPIVISDDGHWCLFADASGMATLTDLQTGYQYSVTMTESLEQRVADPNARKRQVERRPAHPGPVLAVALSKSDPGQDYPAFAATLGEENTVRVWELYPILHPGDGLRSRRWTEAIAREKRPEDPEDRRRRRR